jgi:hypothetical protein
MLCPASRHAVCCGLTAASVLLPLLLLLPCFVLRAARALLLLLRQCHVLRAACVQLLLLLSCPAQRPTSIC